ncbi:MAG TPA: PucR family transcriptional regulator [Clostridiales bacterium UBA8960]|nr:PucR family transcriptional regulator [Clostridiales bacterium UBA8960]
MAITIIEATKLKPFKKFRLMSGMSGLGNMIEKVGILDWEFFSREAGQFVSGEFVLTSLLFAKDNPDYIIEAVKDLVSDGASGLAIKNVYYDELPEDVIQFSNEHAFPIFIFDNSAYFEDIITEVMDKIRFSQNYALLETKVDILIKKSLDKATVKDIAIEINTSFHEHFFVIYLKRKNYSHESDLFALLEKIKRSKVMDLHSSVLKYRTGILMIRTFEKMDERQKNGYADALLEQLEIDKALYYIGTSNFHKDLSELNLGINECLFAECTSEVSIKTAHHYKDIGIYSVILPYKDDVWMKEYYKRIVEPLNLYDEKYGTDLFATAVKYVETEGRILETANALYVHKNTVRYRLEKIREILAIEMSESGFYEQLSIAMKLHRIYSL